MTYPITSAGQFRTVIPVRFYLLPISLPNPRIGQADSGFLPSEQSGYNWGMELAMTLTLELKQAVEKAGEEPVRVEDPETHAAYLIVREDVYRRMFALAAIDHSDRSLYEFGEFYPDR